MKALDLFCGGGGTCIGLQWAGFEVYGIDICEHKHYPGHFIRGDVHHLPVDVRDFDFVWASPPCQMFSRATNWCKSQGKKTSTINLIPITQEILKDHPFTCIENVPEAPIRRDLFLTGPMVNSKIVNGFQIWRRRHFELSFFCLSPRPRRIIPPRGTVSTVAKNGTPNKAQRDRRWEQGLPGAATLAERKALMGIPDHYKMSVEEVGEAVPPPYAKLIGEQARVLIEKGGQ